MNKENNTTMNELAELLRREQPQFMRYACYRLGDTDDAKDALQDTNFVTNSQPMKAKM